MLGSGTGGIIAFPPGDIDVNAIDATVNLKGGIAGNV